VKLNYGKAARLAVSIFVLGAAASAYADTYTFTFKSVEFAQRSERDCCLYDGRTIGQWLRRLQCEGDRGSRGYDL